MPPRSAKSKRAKSGEDGTDIGSDRRFCDIFARFFPSPGDQIFTKRMLANLRLTCKKLKEVVDERNFRLVVPASDLEYFSCSSLVKNCVELMVIDGDMSITNLVHLIAPECPKLKKLDLISNIPPEGLSALGAKTWPNLTAIDIRLDNLRDDIYDLRNLLGASWGNLEEFYFDSSYCSLANIPALAQQLANCRNLKKLSLTGCKLTESDFLTMCTPFNDTLETLNYNWNEQIHGGGNGEAVNLLSATLKPMMALNWSKLTRLDLCSISGEDMVALSSCPVIKQLQCFGVGSMDFTNAPKGLKALLNSLKGTSISVLKMDLPWQAYLEMKGADLPELRGLSCRLMGDGDEPVTNGASVVFEHFVEAKLPKLHDLMLVCSKGPNWFPLAIPEVFGNPSLFPRLNEFFLRCKQMEEESISILSRKLHQFKTLQFFLDVFDENDIQTLLSSMPTGNLGTQPHFPLQTLHIGKISDLGLLELIGAANTMPHLIELSVKFDGDCKVGAKALITASRMGAWAQLKSFECVRAEEVAQQLSNPLDWPDLEDLSIGGTFSQETKEGISRAHPCVNVLFRESVDTEDEYAYEYEPALGFVSSSDDD